MVWRTLLYAAVGTWWGLNFALSALLYLVLTRPFFKLIGRSPWIDLLDW